MSVPGPPTAPDAPDDPDAPALRRELPDRIGWLLLALLTIGVLATWAPTLPAALGDNHEGRILARHALNVTNALEDGLAASGWLSDWSPYVGDGGEQVRYAHHPPLLNLAYYLGARVLPLPTDVTMRLVSYLLGVAILPLGAAVLRRRGLSWWATLTATTAVAITPLFWVHGRLHGNVALLLAMVLLVVGVAEPRRPGRGELAAAAVASTAAIVAGYLGMATAALLGLWLLRRRGIDRVTVVIGVAMAVGAAISLGYVVAGTGAARIGEQVATRTVGGGFTAAEFVARIALWARELLPWWWRWLVLPVGLVAGVLAPRTRPLVVITGLVTVLYVVGLPNGSFVHDYWILPVLLPVWFGTAAAVEQLVQGRGGAASAVVIAALLVVLGAVHGLRDDVPARYLTGPQAAGELVRASGPGPQQTVAWRTDGIAAPRWLSFYWDLPPGQLAPDRLDELRDDDLVLVRLERAPDWAGDPDELAAGAVERRGGYLLVRGGELAERAAAATG